MTVLRKIAKTNKRDVPDEVFKNFEVNFEHKSRLVTNSDCFKCGTTAGGFGLKYLVS